MGTIPAVVVDGFERVAELDRRITEIRDDIDAARRMHDERTVGFKLSEEAAATADLVNYVLMFTESVLEGHMGLLEPQPVQGPTCWFCAGDGRFDDIECNYCRGTGKPAGEAVAA